MTSLGDLFERADAALMVAKTNGRDAISVSQTVLSARSDCGQAILSALLKKWRTVHQRCAHYRIQIR